MKEKCAESERNCASEPKSLHINKITVVNDTNADSHVSISCDCDSIRWTLTHSLTYTHMNTMHQPIMHIMYTCTFTTAKKKKRKKNVTTWNKHLYARARVCVWVCTLPLSFIWNALNAQNVAPYNLHLHFFNCALYTADYGQKKNERKFLQSADRKLKIKEMQRRCEWFHIHHTGKHTSWKWNKFNLNWRNAKPLD